MTLHSLVRRIRRPVRREHAGTSVQLMLLSFAASVGATRLILELTGYPSLATGELHIAHVLWGGLLLLVCSGLAATVVDHHPGSTRCQTQGNRSTDSSRATGYKGDLACEIHPVLLKFPIPF